MAQFHSLSNDSLIDILMYCSDDLRSVMNFAMTCSEYYHIVTECSERFWIFILNKLIDERSKTNTTGRGKRKGFKPKTLSILENSVKLVDRTKQLMSIIRTQLRYDRKHEILMKYNDLPMTSRYRYFAKQVEIKDEYLRKIMEKKIVESLVYSPETIIMEKFDNSPSLLLDFHSRTHTVHIQDVVDALFRKKGAHLCLDIHNRTMSSCIYEQWKEEHKNKNTSIDYVVRHYRSSVTFHCQDANNCLLILKLIYLELPNLSVSKDVSTDETAYEQDRHTRGSFKPHLRFYKRSPLFKQACDTMAIELYQTTDF